MKNLTVSVDVKGMEIVQELIKVMRDFADDKRIPISVREDFMDRVNDILENR